MSVEAPSIRPALVSPRVTLMVLLRPASSSPVARLFSELAVTLRSRPALTLAPLSMAPPTDRVRSRPAAMLPVWLSEPA
ncbi:hypothetical protein D9M68_717740 [compost metagenome]